MSDSWTLWTVALQASLSTGFSRQEYWNGLPFFPPGDIPDPGIKPRSPSSPALASRFFYHCPNWKAPTRAYYLAIKKNEVLTPDNNYAKWKNQMHKILYCRIPFIHSYSIHSIHILIFHSYEMSKRGKPTEMRQEGW